MLGLSRLCRQNFIIEAGKHKANASMIGEISSIIEEASRKFQLK